MEGGREGGEYMVKNVYCSKLRNILITFDKCWRSKLHSQDRPISFYVYKKWYYFYMFLNFKYKL